MCTFDVAYTCSRAKQSREKRPGIYHLCIHKLSSEIMEYCMQLLTDCSIILPIMHCITIHYSGAVHDSSVVMRAL